MRSLSILLPLLGLGVAACGLQTPGANQPLGTTGATGSFTVTATRAYGLGGAGHMVVWEASEDVGVDIYRVDVSAGRGPQLVHASAERAGRFFVVDPVDSTAYQIRVDAHMVGGTRRETLDLRSQPVVERLRITPNVAAPGQQVMLEWQVRNSEWVVISGPGYYGPGSPGLHMDLSGSGSMPITVESGRYRFGAGDYAHGLHDFVFNSNPTCIRPTIQSVQVYPGEGDRPLALSVEVDVCGTVELSVVDLDTQAEVARFPTASGTSYVAVPVDETTQVGHFRVRIEQPEGAAERTVTVPGP